MFLAFGAPLNTRGFTAQATSALNSAGFANQVSNCKLPDADHITYAGVFNEIEYDVGPKTDKVVDLHLGFCRASNPSSAQDKNIN